MPLTHTSNHKKCKIWLLTKPPAKEVRAALRAEAKLGSGHRPDIVASLRGYLVDLYREEVTAIFIKHLK